MSKFNQNWYLAYTKPNQEKKVAKQLEEYNIEYLLPQTRTLRQWHDRKKVIDMPLFPSYIFVYLTSATDYYTCMDFDGFCSYVKFGNQVATVSTKTIENIKLIISGGENVEVATDDFNEGERVVINQGPLSGLSCEMVEYKGKQKVCVRIKMLNRMILTDVDRTVLSNIPAPVRL